MKLRIHHNSIRLRLGRTEVADLAAGLPIEARVGLLPEPLLYRLEAVSAADVVTAGFSHGELRVILPRARVERWAGSEDEVGIEEAIPAAGRGGGSVRVLVEKDFHCLHGPATGEDQADTFPNPRVAEPDAAEREREE